MPGKPLPSVPIRRLIDPQMMVKPKARRGEPLAAARKFAQSPRKGRGTY